MGTPFAYRATAALPSIGRLEMMSRIPVIAALLSLLLAGACKGKTDQDLSRPPPPDEPGAVPAQPAAPATPADVTGPLSFPSGFDYPLSQQVLEQAVQNRDTARLRRHGWYLFAGLHTSAANGLPIWRTWPTSTQAFAAGAEGQAAQPTAPAPADSAAPAGSQATGTAPVAHLIARNQKNIVDSVPLPQYPVPDEVCQAYSYGTSCPGMLGTRSKPPALFQIPDGAVFQNNGDIMIAGVIYDQTAFDWIRKASGGGAGLYQAATLTQMLPAKGELAQIPGFPSTSFVLKHMYWPVKKDRCSALPVWDDQKPPTPNTYMGYETWPRAVAIDTPGCSAAPGATTKVSFLHGVFDVDGQPMQPRVFESAKVVPLDAFFHQTLTREDLDALTANDRAILDTASYWAYGEPFTDDDIIVSIAMHIFTKEMPAWTMQSLWWHDQPDQGPYAADRPDIPPTQAPPAWRHYLMVVEDGIPDARDPTQLPAHFNPYIELVIHPVATNCRTCHTRAAWPRRSTGLTPFSGYQFTPVSEDPGLTANLSWRDPIFQSLLMLDFQWAIADRAIPLDYRATP
jgi:hypothetical protein